MNTSMTFVRSCQDNARIDKKNEEKVEEILPSFFVRNCMHKTTFIVKMLIINDKLV